MLRIVLIVHDVRSAHNVGSILRSADGFGVNYVYLTGYTPYPAMVNDERLPHIVKRASEQIAKTALGAEKTLRWQHQSDIFELISKLRKEGYLLVALEQTDQALRLPEFKAKGDIALIVGSEIGGISPDLLKAIDTHLVIPMLGGKESFNVSVASAVALYHLRWRKL
ncbi:MAG TPA: TrmH family RNA methyltransferase [Candidatus Saccharimonadales bacterium]|nr:TrmH family RNA methyltransferase [Candidatus Saccharimonadales bacterium]